MASIPAQWTSSALLTALGGNEAPTVAAALFVVAATAAATRLVEQRWSACWPYEVMFTIWLVCSALVGLGAPA